MRDTRVIMIVTQHMLDRQAEKDERLKENNAVSSTFNAHSGEIFNNFRGLDAR